MLVFLDSIRQITIKWKKKERNKAKKRKKKQELFFTCSTISDTNRQWATRHDHDSGIVYVLFNIFIVWPFDLHLIRIKCSVENSPLWDTPAERQQPIANNNNTQQRQQQQQRRPARPTVSSENRQVVNPQWMTNNVEIHNGPRFEAQFSKRSTEFREKRTAIVNKTTLQRLSPQFGLRCIDASSEPKFNSDEEQKWIVSNPIDSI